MHHATQIRPVTLFYQNNSHRGPGKVVKNLEKGLDLLGIPHGPKYKFMSDVPSLIGCLQDVPNPFTGSDLLVGPNLFVLPTDWPEAKCRKYNHYLVPSQWVHDLYRRFHQLDHASIDVWPVGIDVEKWSEFNRQSQELRCLLYYKNRSSQDLQATKTFIHENQISNIRIIEYGKYTEGELIEACEWANFCVLLTDTESQGIAYMEILSTNLPCFVLDKWYWNNENTYDKVPASSVPYFDNSCGEKTRNLNKDLFQNFITKVKNKDYTPRKFILENHTLEKGAKLYYSLLNKYQSL